jgi:hypothetical protein
MREMWSRFLRLRGFERGVVLEAAAELPVMWAAVRLAGVEVCKGALTQAAGHRQVTDSSTLAAAQRIARLQSITATTLFPGMTCLEQSLVLFWMLHRRGMNPQFRIGGRKEAGRFEAHAWVEMNGTVIDGRGAEHLHFAPFRHVGSSVEARS